MVEKSFNITKDNLEPALNGFLYYYRSAMALSIDVEMSEANIKVKVEKDYKGHVSGTLTKRSALVGKMTKEQVQDYVLDIVEKFLKGERDEKIKEV